MKKILLILLFGAIGAMLRFAIEQMPINAFMPLTTLLVNVIGSFILGYLVAKKEQTALKIGLMTGFCGALTTFGTVMKQLTELSIIPLLLYAVLSIGLGLLAAYAGMRVSAKEVAK